MKLQPEPSNGSAIGRIGLRALVLAMACLSVLAWASSLAFAQEPANGRIAFERSGEIFSMNADGSAVRQLTAGLGNRSNPAFSPDGQKIAFELHPDDCASVIVVMNADGSDETNLTDPNPDGCEPDYEPAWAPDGQKLAFSSRRDGNDFEIFVVNADGSGLSQVTDDADEDFGSSFSPDGAQIAFSTPGDAGTYAIHTIGVDGQGQQQLTSPSPDGTDDQPDWSPDGQRVAFRGYDESSEIVTVGADGSDRDTVTQASYHKSQPDWAPDGSRLAYAITGNTHDNKGLHSVAADGSDDTPLEDGRDPSWGTSTDVPQGIPTISVDDVTVAEGTAFDGSTTPAEFTVSLSRASNAPVAVNYDLDEGPEADSRDFDLISGTVTFAPGETEKKVVVPVYPDDVDESDETFELRLNNGVGGGIDYGRATATIADDDDPRPEATIDDISVDEGTADDGSTTPATFTVSLDEPASHPMRAQVSTSDGTAQEGSDYSGRSEPVIFASGETEKQFTVDVIPDSRPEPDQDFELRLGWAEDDGGDSASGTATIVDDEKISINDVSVVEGTASDGSTTPATFTLSLAQAQAKPITVEARTADGVGEDQGRAARAGGDYASLSEDVTFAPGEKEKQVTVGVVRDDRAESNERFSLLAEVADEVQPVASGVATITDDDESTAPVGLANPSFEEGLDGWSASRLPDGFAAGRENGACEVPRGICAVGTDTFTDSDSGTPWTVTPLDGDNMARLGGPFTAAEQNQDPDRYLLEQTFKVDPANPKLDLNYNVFAYDYTGFDELRIKVSLFDEDGDLIAREVQGAYGEGTALKNTGWQDASVDLSGYEGEQVHLKIDSGGTQDNFYGLWAYVDAGDVPEPVVDGGSAESSAPPTPGGDPVSISQYPGGPGQTWFTVPAGQAAQFPDGCMPFTVSVPINAGAGTVSNVQLRLHGSSGATAVPMSESNGVWTATLPCAQTGDLLVEYDLTEEGVTQRFVVPIGGVVLVDPQGVVHDKQKYDQAIAAGKTPEQARAESAIDGASVRLQRKNEDGDFVNVLSGDPGIDPNVNPEITGPNGLYQWDVSPGTYRVIVTKDGYEPVTSPAVDIPPPVLDLHIPMEKVRVDETPPSTSHSVSPQANAAGWHKDDATVTLSAADEQDGSGVKEIVWSASGAGASGGQTVPGATATVPVIAEGETTIAYRARDNAGNLSGEKSVTVKLDKTKPAIDCADADGQWHAGNVSIGCSAQDSRSGLSAGDQSFALGTSVAAGGEGSNAETGSREVCDAAGNCSTAGPIGGNKVDRKNPGATIDAPKGTLKLGQVVKAAFRCLDGGSGIASCVGGVANRAAVNTKSIGAKTFSVSARDKVGNRSTASSSYKVIYNFSGFFKPLANAPKLNQVKVGDKSVPLRFSLNGNQGLKVLAAGYPQSRQVNCKTLGALRGKKWTGSSPAGLKYDRRQRRYTYTWSIGKRWANTCRQFALKLKDGTVHQANFKFIEPK